MAVNFQLSNSTFTTNSPDATLNPGETLTIQLQFNKPFVIEGGQPRLLLNNGDYATLSAQSGSTMTFTYTPTAGSPQASPLTFGAHAYDANGSTLNPGNERPVSEPGNIGDLNNYDPPGIGGVTCFLPGTLINTSYGDRAIEDLAIGDHILTASGRAAPIRWIGRQTVSLRFTSPDRALPIRIRAGALGDGLPVRDLLVSPAHAILVDGILANAGALVNGTTIRREDDVPQVFTYYNIELAEHDLLLAEGVPAETFVDNVSRNTFDNGAEHAALYGDVTIPEMDLPRATAHRQIPAATRQRLAAIAAAMDEGTAAAA